MVKTELHRGKFLAAILAGVSVPGKDIPPVKLDFASRQPVIEKQPDDSRHCNMEIDGGYPVVAVGFELSLEPADVAP